MLLLLCKVLEKSVHCLIMVLCSGCFRESWSRCLRDEEGVVVEHSGLEALSVGCMQVAIEHNKPAQNVIV